MWFKMYLKPEKCVYCGEKAEYVFIKNTFFSVKVRDLCAGCRRKHTQIINDNKGV